MIDDAANLSIDFLAGFTIFMISFIYVATLIPTLLLGLQGSTIDYNAVAYRTGVILVEDPGAPVSWENPGVYSNYYIQTNGIRFGLAVSRDTPNILSQQKLNRFFCSTEFVYPADYRSRAVFGNYPYLFNISLTFAGNSTTQSIGDILPNGYGYVRRVVLLKGWSNATIGNATIYQQKTNVTIHSFTILLNSTDLLNNATNPACTNPVYQINPWEDQIVVNLTNLNMTYNPLPPTPIVNLVAITFLRAQQSQPYPNPSLSVLENFSSSNANLTTVPPFYVYNDSNSTPQPALPVIVNNSLSLTFTPGFFYQMGNNNVYQQDTTTQLYIRLTFQLNNADWYFNNTYPGGQPFSYNYDPTNVTQPGLRSGVMEIAVW
jgi:hypothetical protein